MNNGIISKSLIEAFCEDDVKRIKSDYSDLLSSVWGLQASEEDTPLPMFMLAAITGSCDVITALNPKMSDLSHCDVFNVFQYAILFNQPKADAQLCFLAGQKSKISPYRFRFYMIETNFHI